MQIIMFCCSYYLVHIFNKCIDHCYFPDISKEAYVIPLPKTLKSLKFSQLRNISLVPKFFNIIEKTTEI